MRSVRRLLVLCFGLASCAVGVDSGSDPTGVGEGGTKVDGSSHDGAAGDSAPAYDTGAMVSDTGSSGSDAGVAETASGGDTGAATDTGPDTSATDSGCAGHGTTGALVTFNLSTQSGSETSAAATSSVNGVTSGAALTRAAPLTAVSGSGSINASGWPSSATANTADYFTLTVTPMMGCSVTLSSLALDVQASPTGPSKGDVATSADAFASHTASFAGSATPTVTLSGASGTGPIEVRVYGYGASSSAGTFRIQKTLTVSGSIN